MYRITLLLTASMLFVADAAAGQTRPTLYYFVTGEQKTGVKESNGNILIPARYSPFTFDRKSGDTVAGDLIYLGAATPQSDTPGYGTPVQVYNRKGQLLFRPFWFDNGPDYNSEGLFRIVQDRKIGFADRHGHIVITPQFGFATPFLYGLSFFCNDCTFYRDSLADPEHNLRLTPAAWGVVAKDGTLLKPQVAAHREVVSSALLADYMWPGLTDDRLDITDSLLAQLPSQFVYTPFEQGLLRRFSNSPQLGSAVGYNLPSEARGKMRYEIVERPQGVFSYYWVKGFQVIDGVYHDAEENFLLSADGKTLYRYQPYDDTKERVLSWQEKMRLKR